MPWTPGWSWLDLLWNTRVQPAGWTRGRGTPGNRLYVNRGLGMSGMPLRINCRPEVTLFTLYPAFE